MYYGNAPVSPPNSENKKKAKGDDMSVDYDKAIQKDIKEMIIQSLLHSHITLGEMERIGEDN